MLGGPGICGRHLAGSEGRLCQEVPEPQRCVAAAARQVAAVRAELQRQNRLCVPCGTRHWLQLPDIRLHMDRYPVCLVNLAVTQVLGEWLWDNIDC